MHLIVVTITLIISVVSCNAPSKAVSNSIEYLVDDIDNLKVNEHGLITLRTYRTKEVVEIKPSEVYDLICLFDMQIFTSKFPKELLIFKNLESLWLAHTDFSHFPEEIFEFKKLRELNLSYNQIKEIPPSIIKLENLEKLDLISTELIGLPSSMEQLTNLKDLAIESCYFESTPEVLFKLKKLNSLTLNNTQERKIKCFQMDSKEAKLLESSLPNTKILRTSN